MLMYGGLSFVFTRTPVIVRHPAEAGHKYGHVCARQCGSADFSGSKIIAPSASLFLSPRPQLLRLLAHTSKWESSFKLCPKDSVLG